MPPELWRCVFEFLPLLEIEPLRFLCLLFAQASAHYFQWVQVDKNVTIQKALELYSKSTGFFEIRLKVPHFKWANFRAPYLRIQADLRLIYSHQGFRIQGDLQDIPEEYFYGCTLLQAAHLPQVRTIGPAAFAECHAMESFLGRPQTIGEKAFLRNTSLKNIDLSRARHIGPRAFMQCISLSKERPYIGFGDLEKWR